MQPMSFVLSNVSIYRSNRLALNAVNIDVPAPGFLFLMGPGGAGKSTILGGLAGSESDTLRIEGDILLNQRSVGRSDVRINRIPQHLRLGQEGTLAEQLTRCFGLSHAQSRTLLLEAGLGELAERLDQPSSDLSPSERRVAALLAALNADAELVLADEPTSDLSDAHRGVVRQALARVGQRQMAVVVTHDRGDCLALGGHTALLAGGTVQECAPTPQFFGSPTTQAGELYVKTGNCALGRTAHEALAEGIWSLMPGLLYGMSRPGIVAPAEQQLTALQQAGVRRLICLEERCRIAAALPRAHGISLHHFAVADMAPPSFTQMVDICRLADRAIAANEGIVMHCRGGLGRTGTALAGVLVWFGDDPATAIARVRAGHALAIQSAAQERFISDFADRIAGWHSPDQHRGS